MGWDKMEGISMRLWTCTRSRVEYKFRKWRQALSVEILAFWLQSRTRIGKLCLQLQSVVFHCTHSTNLCTFTHRRRLLEISHSTRPATLFELPGSYTPLPAMLDRYNKLGNAKMVLQVDDQADQGTFHTAAAVKLRHNHAVRSGRPIGIPSTRSEDCHDASHPCGQATPVRPRDVVSEHPDGMRYTIAVGSCDRRSAVAAANFITFVRSRGAALGPYEYTDADSSETPYILRSV